jgi:hypothetical protein
MDYELEMARRSYGYGRWDAPYWFIGPEQGKGQAESSGNSQRVNAWQKLGQNELCDCLDFHAQISDMSWHRGRPSLQPTWRPLILLLKTFLNQPSDIESLREYQRDRWGRVKGGETCWLNCLDWLRRVHRYKLTGSDSGKKESELSVKDCGPRNPYSSLCTV